MKTFDIDIKELIDFKKRKYVRAITNKAVRNGLILRPCSCDLCGCASLDIDAHHKDYGRPLDVIWLCATCHGQAHRNDSALNPRNNAQTPLPYICDHYNTVTVAFSLPIKHFLALKDEAKRSKKTISAVMRESAIKRFPVKADQLEFNFFEGQGEKNDKIENQNLRFVENVDRRVQQQRISVIPKIRRCWSVGLQRMGRKLQQFFSGHGGNSRTVHADRAAR